MLLCLLFCHMPQRKLWMTFGIQFYFSLLLIQTISDRKKAVTGFKKEFNNHYLTFDPHFPYRFSWGKESSPNWTLGSQHQIIFTGNSYHSPAALSNKSIFQSKLKNVTFSFKVNAQVQKEGPGLKHPYRESQDVQKKDYIDLNHSSVCQHCAYGRLFCSMLFRMKMLGTIVDSCSFK